MTSAAAPVPEALLTGLAAHADRADGDLAWPAASWRLLTAAGVPRWSVPTEYGGLGLGPPALLTGYERLASACLTTAFVLSQHEAAVRRLLAHGSAALKADLLPRVAAGELLLTVGLSQLTTSRQHGAPSLTATARPDGGYAFDGVIPWVTSADVADRIVIGAALADGRQLLALLEKGQAGVTVEAPLALTALAGSRTAQVRCADAVLPPAQLLTAPTAQVLAVGKGGVGGLETSCLALGLAGAIVAYLGGETDRRPDLATLAERFREAHQRLRERLRQLALGEPDNAAVIGLRVEATLLALQASQTAVAVAKGTGFVAPHPAQRWARQALFFLVWSCPRPAAEGILARLLPEEGA